MDTGKGVREGLEEWEGYGRTGGGKKLGRTWEIGRGVGKTGERTF